VLGVLGALNSISRNPSLDRLIRGRTWIALIAFALIGIVTLQLLVLRLNANIGGALVREAQLQRENAALSIESSELAAGERVESLATRMGMELVPEGALRFLTSDPRADIGRAAAALSKPVHASSASSSETGGGAASGASSSETSGGAATGSAGETSSTSEASTGSSASASAGSTTGQASEASATSTESSAGVAGESPSASSPASAVTQPASGEVPATAAVGATGATEAAPSGGASGTPASGTPAGGTG
jgi:cell division protein FtsL